MADPKRLSQILDALMAQESGTQGSKTPDNPDTGALGPWQLMPATLRGLGYKGDVAAMRDSATARPWAQKLLEQNLDRAGGNENDAIAMYYSGKADKDAAGNYTGSGGKGYPNVADYVKQVETRMAPQEAAPSLDPAAAAPMAAMPDNTGVVDDSFDKLTAWLGQNQPITDISKYYQPAIDEARDRELPNRPGAIQSFFATLGAPKNAPEILQSRFEDYAKAHAQKHADLLRLQQALGEHAFDQAVKQGDVRVALAQARSNAQLHEKLYKLHADQENTKAGDREKTRHSNVLAEIVKRTEAKAAPVPKEIRPGDLAKMELEAQKQDDPETALRTLYMTTAMAGGPASELAAGHLGRILRDSTSEHLTSPHALRARLKMLGITDPKIGAAALRGAGFFAR